MNVPALLPRFLNGVNALLRPTIAAITSTSTYFNRHNIFFGSTTIRRVNHKRARLTIGFTVTNADLFASKYCVHCYTAVRIECIDAFIIVVFIFVRYRPQPSESHPNEH